jgi:hypothetical protein
VSVQSTDVAIIMPTAAHPERARGLARAIGSVLSQVNARGVPLVVVNGMAASSEVLRLLRRRTDIRLAVLDDASLPHALEAGRAMVDTPYFGVLDDDDELLPYGLSTRLDAFAADPDADVIVTNGYLEGVGRRSMNIADFAAIQADPLRRLLEGNWLPPCAGLFRTNTVTPDFFVDIPRYREWTYLALCLARRRRIRFTARPTFVYRTDTPGSLSKSRAYALAGPTAIQRMLAIDLPTDVRAALRAHLAADLHSVSRLELADGHYGAAWSAHLRSLLQPPGWRYLRYTARLLAATLFRAPLHVGRSA